MVIKETQTRKVVGGASERKGSGTSSNSEIQLPTSFRGNFCHTLDDKGRVSLPSEFRLLIEERKESSIVLTNYISQGSRCLEGFDLGAWETFESKLREKSRFSPKLQRLENFYLSRAAECAIDRSGRILVPTHLRSYASLDRDLTFTSSIHGFRIWNSKVWDVVFSEAEQALLTDPEIFSEIDI